MVVRNTVLEAYLDTSSCKFVLSSSANSNPTCVLSMPKAKGKGKTKSNYAYAAMPW